MPANLNNPFGESCCDGGACSTKESAQPCGCDKGANHMCEQHKQEFLRTEVEDIRYDIMYSYHMGGEELINSRYVIDRLSKALGIK